MSRVVILAEVRNIIAITSQNPIPNITTDTPILLRYLDPIRNIRDSHPLIFGGKHICPMADQGV